MKTRKGLFLHVLFLLLVSLTLCAPASAIRFVDAAAPGPGHDGLTWATAYLTIQAGVSDAANLDNTVWVAAGTYQENVNLTANHLAYGGFHGDEDPLTFNLADRDFVTDETIVEPGVATTSLFTAATGTRIDGFTIQDGEADSGAAIRCTGTSCIVANCVFDSNTSVRGAGINASGTTLTVSDCTFTDNVARDTVGTPGIAMGGAIYALTCTLAVSDSTFEDNVALVSNALLAGPTASGGAIYSSGGTSTRIERCRFDNCIATGAVLPTYYAYGGAICTSGTTTRLYNNFIYYCAARGAGAKKTSYGGGLAFRNQGTLYVINNTFYGNEVTPQAGNIGDNDRSYGLGAAVYGAGSTNANIINNIISYCRGTAVVCEGMTVTFNYNLLWHNAGGDIYGFNFPLYSTNPLIPNKDFNIMRDPQFRDVTTSDFHILYGSPARDTAYNNLAPGTDIDGEIRPNYSGPPPTPSPVRADIGADEFVDTTGGPLYGKADNDTLAAYTGVDADADLIDDGAGIDNCTGCGVPAACWNPHQMDSNGDGEGDVTTQVSRKVLYVDGDAPAGGNGYTWATAFNNIQEAINSADYHNIDGTDFGPVWQPQIGNGNPAVWVKSLKDGGGGIVPYEENIMIWHGIRVYGGWAGTEPYSPDAYINRDFTANETIIDGTVENSVVVIAHLPQDRYLPDTPASDLNTIKKMYDRYLPYLDGFTIINGLAELGGGVSVYKETADISLCIIEDNIAALGGGVYMYKSDGVLGDANAALPGGALTGEQEISDNTATGPESYAGYGGGVYIERGAPTVFSNIMEGNTAYFGGAIAARRSGPSFVMNQIGCSTDPNVADVTAGTGLGGGVYLEDSDASFNMDTIVDNIASGGTAGYGGGIYATLSDFWMKNSIVAFNTATSGGAIYSPLFDSIPTITYSDFFGNSVPQFNGVADPTLDPTNLGVDPYFVDQANCDYHLEPLTPLGDPNPLVGGGDPFDGYPNMGAFQDEDPPVSISETKKLTNGAVVMVSSAVVTAVFPDCFYMEEPKRISAIKVLMYGAKVKEGQVVDVSGVLSSSGTERQLVDAKILDIQGTRSAIKPLALSNKGLGGGSIGKYTPGVTKAVGLNNVGLLVKTWGRVKSVTSGTYSYFVIDDGSKSPVKVIPPSGTRLPAVGAVAVVTGISCIDSDGKGSLSRAIRIRKESDISYPR